MTRAAAEGRSPGRPLADAAEPGRRDRGAGGTSPFRGRIRPRGDMDPVRRAGSGGPRADRPELDPRLAGVRGMTPADAGGQSPGRPSTDAAEPGPCDRSAGGASLSRRRIRSGGDVDPVRRAASGRPLADMAELDPRRSGVRGMTPADAGAQSGTPSDRCGGAGAVRSQRRQRISLPPQDPPRRRYGRGSPGGIGQALAYMAEHDPRRAGSRVVIRADAGSRSPGALRPMRPKRDRAAAAPGAHISPGAAGALAAIWARFAERPRAQPRSTPRTSAPSATGALS
jgi:hypothetical protein